MSDFLETLASTPQNIKASLVVVLVIGAILLPTWAVRKGRGAKW